MFTNKNSIKNKLSGSWFTASNVLTILRMVATPFVAMGIYFQWWSVTFLLFIFTALSDLLDGYLARIWDQQTQLGALLDPLADKIFLVCCFFSLTFFSSPSFQIPFWFFFLECVREVTILLGTYIVLKIKTDFSVQPSQFGKLTTFFQLVFIFWIFVCHFFNWYPVKTFSVVTVVLASFSLFSLAHYVVIGIRVLRKK